MKKHNFSAGPSILPDVAYQNAAKAILDFNGTGLSILSISHRTKDFEAVLDSAQALMRELLSIPENYHIYFVGGGASTQFFHIPANFLGKKAGYVNTGVWTKKAIKEAKFFGEVVEVAPVATNEAVETVAEVAVNDPESATETPTQSTGGGMSMWIMLALIFVVMWFFMIRPQQKKQKEIAKFRDNLKKGDKIVTVGGIYGVVAEVKENHLLVEVDNGVKIKVDKTCVVNDITDVQGK